VGEDEGVSRERDKAACSCIGKECVVEAGTDDIDTSESNKKREVEHNRCT